MKKIRIGILGSGYMGRTHAEAIRRLPKHAELVAVHGGTRAPGLAERYGMAFEADKATLLQRRDIDAIVVTTPHHLHVEETLGALAQGKHVLVEKPLATSVADCDRMLAAAAQRKLTLAVGYQQRFRVNNVKTCEIIKSGAIGKVLAVQVSMPMYAGAIKAGGFGGNWAWWNDPASLGHLLNSAPHAIDLLRKFTGGEVVTVSALSRTFLPEVPVEDTTMGLLEFSTGTICSIFSSRALPAPSFPGEDFRFRITGSTGLLDLDPYGELRQSDERGWRVVCQQPPVKHEAADAAFGDVRMQAYCDQMSAFIAAIDGQPSNVGTGADGRAAVVACVAMLDSSAGRCWITPRAQP
jgi:predicted dehydrogenase